MNDASSTSPDISEIDRGRLPSQQFPATTQSDYRVFFEPSAHEAVWSHARENTTIEICGFLVGKIRQDDGGPYLHVAHAVRCDSATSKFAEVTFTHESWNEINRQMDAEFRELDIVGWYHTHPDFGIFLSDRDCFIHENFFSGPGQIAQVVDPIRQIEGVFTWQKSKPVPAEYFWIGNRLVADTHSEKVAGGSEPRRMPAPGNSPGNPAASRQSEDRSAEQPLPDWQMVLSGALPLVLAFLIGWMVNGWRNSGKSDWEQQTLQRGVIDRLQLWKTLRPGLRQKLETVDKTLAAVEQNLDIMSTDHLQQAKDDKARSLLQKQWTMVRLQVRAVRDAADTMKSTYGLTPSEEESLLAVLQIRQPKSVPGTDSATPPQRKTVAPTDSKTTTVPKSTGDSKAPTVPKAPTDAKAATDPKSPETGGVAPTGAAAANGSADAGGRDGSSAERPAVAEPPGVLRNPE